MLSEVRLKLLELNLQWPKEVPLEELRFWILGQISDSGEPLRWAITAIHSTGDDLAIFQLKVEAVVMIS